MRVIISGGGSGGHIFPAIAIANALKADYPNIEILFVGAKGKIEMDKVPKAGYPIEGLWISGFHRKLTLRNLMFPIKLLSSLWKAFWILRKFKPDVVVGVGGFASGPTLAVASRLGIPCLIQEQNSYPGVTNKLLASQVRKICVAYNGLERFFPKDRIVKTGNPVRQDIMDLEGKRAEGIQHFGFDPNKKIIFLFGGSLGASALNKAMAANVESLSAKQDIQVFWQAGKLYIDEYQNSETAQLPNVKISAFVDRMDLAYAMADVIICRAGASTISELSLAGKAAILVPSPNVAEDHQTHNAKALTDNNAAIMVADKDAASKMIDEAVRILSEPGLKSRLIKNIKALGKPDAAKHIAKEVTNLISM